jgi:pimeloyl-ACP methyl ester carboxylesterase
LWKRTASASHIGASANRAAFRSSSTSASPVISTTGIRQVLDGLAVEREIVLFNNPGVAGSSGEVSKTFAEMAKNAAAFISTLGVKRVDVLGFSIGGMVAQNDCASLS